MGGKAGAQQTLAAILDSQPVSQTEWDELAERLTHSEECVWCTAVLTRGVETRGQLQLQRDTAAGEADLGVPAKRGKTL